VDHKPDEAIAGLNLQEAAPPTMLETNLVDLPEEIFRVKSASIKKQQHSAERKLKILYSQLP